MKTLSFSVPSEQQIETQFRTLIFGSRVCCPHCRRTDIRVSESRYRCRSCRAKFSLTSATWMRGTKLSWSQRWILLWCFCHQYQPRQASELSAVTLRIAREWYDRFRVNLPERERKLSLLVCADEAYFGRRRTGNQRIAAGALEVRSKELRLREIPDTEQDSIELFLWRHVDPKTLLRTDEHASYHGIEWMGYGRDAEKHANGQFAKTSPIERAWSYLKWLIRRMYHHIWGRRLSLFLREFEWRFSAPETFDSPLTLAAVLLRPVPTRD